MVAKQRGTDASFLDLVREIGAAVGRRVPSRPTPAWVLRALGAFGALQSRVTGRAPTLTPEAARMVTRDVSCDSAKAMRELGYRAVCRSAKWCATASPGSPRKASSTG